MIVRDLIAGLEALGAPDAEVRFVTSESGVVPVEGGFYTEEEIGHFVLLMRRPCAPMGGF